MVSGCDDVAFKGATVSGVADASWVGIAGAGGSGGCWSFSVAAGAAPSELISTGVDRGNSSCGLFAFVMF